MKEKDVSKIRVRNSSIELLKLFAIIMIVFSHSMPALTEKISALPVIPDYFMDLSQATSSFQRLVIVFFRYGGQIGNTIFVACSAYFLAESKILKVKKVLYIAGDTFLISVTWLAVTMAAGYDLPAKEIIRQFIPITMNTNWFVAAYLLLFAIHPLLNIVIRALPQKNLLQLNLGLFAVYSLINTLLPYTFYFTKLTGFVCIYFFVAYMKLYLKKTSESFKINLAVLIISFSGLWAMILATNLLGLRISLFANEVDRWRQFINPFIILMSLAAFNLAKEKHFTSKTINYLSSLSLLIYLIHENMLFRDYMRYDIYAYIYETFSYQKELLWVILMAIGHLILGIILAIIYKSSVKKLLTKIIDGLYSKLSPAGSRLLERIMKVE